MAEGAVVSPRPTAIRLSLSSRVCRLLQCRLSSDRPYRCTEVLLKPAQPHSADIVILVCRGRCYGVAYVVQLNPASAFSNHTPDRAA